MPLTEIACSSAEEFLQSISPRKLRERARAARPHLTLPERWMFRGQGDADWRLVPSAFRPRARFRTDHGWATISEFVDRIKREWPGLGVGPHDAMAQVWAEADTLEAFVRVADASGLTLPEDSQLLRKDLHLSSGPPTEDWVGWPTLALRSCLALAQHHGLPTRLLDWSLDHSVAAFLAAKSAIKDRSNALAVWALDGRSLEAEVRWVEMCEPNHATLCKLRIVTAPAATNPNLRAQRGLFTLLEGPSGTLKTLDAKLGEEMRPVDEVIAGMKDMEMVKTTVPTTEARRVLDLLALEGVTAARLFPGYDGVVASLRDEELLEEPTSLAGTSARVGVTQVSLRDLLRGKADPEVAKKLGIQPNDLEQFLEGSAPVAIASLLGLSTDDVRSITREAGTERLRWFVLGLLMK